MVVLDLILGMPYDPPSTAKRNSWLSNMINSLHKPEMWHHRYAFICAVNYLCQVREKDPSSVSLPHCKFTGSTGKTKSLLLCSLHSRRDTHIICKREGQVGG